MSIYNRLTGINPIAYMGDEAITPPDLKIETRSPSTHDKKNYALGTLWIVPGDEMAAEIWILLGLTQSSAIWFQIYPSSASGGSAASLFVTDSGNAIPVMNELNVFGNVATATSGTGNTVTLGLSDGQDGEILIGSTGNTPQWGTITSTGGTVSVTGGSNSLNLESVASGAANYITDSGTAMPAANEITVAGGLSINTAGAGNTVTINLDDTIDVTGTLTIQSLGRGVVQSTSAGLLFSDEGTDGQAIISSSSGASAWANITSNDASITITNGSNTIDMIVAGGGGGNLGSRFAFLAWMPSNLAVLGYTTTYVFGASNSVILTEYYDPEGVFYPGDGSSTAASFTCSSTGKYLLTFWVRYNVNHTGSDVTTTQLDIVTSNRTYTAISCKTLSGNTDFMEYGFSVVADFESGDTATWQTSSNLGNVSYAGDISIAGSAVSFLGTYMSGCLIA